MTATRRLQRIVRAKVRRLVAPAPSLTAAEDAKTPLPAPLDPQRERCLAVLELTRDATAEQVRSAYRRMCRRYHPDRFAGSPEKSRVANQVLMEINAAYAYLTACASSSS